MKTRLLWKLFGLNLFAVGLVVLIVWGAVDYLAGGYFVVLMEKYHISPTESHGMFVESIHRYLIWGSVCAVLFSSLISYIVMKRILERHLEYQAASGFQHPAELGKAPVRFRKVLDYIQ